MKDLKTTIRAVTSITAITILAASPPAFATSWQQMSAREVVAKSDIVVWGTMRVAAGDSTRQHLASGKIIVTEYLKGSSSDKVIEIAPPGHFGAVYYKNGDDGVWCLRRPREQHSSGYVLFHPGCFLKGDTRWLIKTVLRDKACLQDTQDGIATMLALFNSDLPSAVDHGAYLFGEANAKAQEETLRQYLKNASPRSAIRTVAKIAHTQTETVVSFLNDCVMGEDYSLMSEACRIIGGAQVRGCEPTLITAVVNEKKHWHPAKALGALRATNAVPVLVEIASNTGFYDNAGILTHALGQIGDRRAAAVIVDRITWQGVRNTAGRVTHFDASDNKAAVWAAGEMKLTEAIEPIFAFMQKWSREDLPDFRRTAVAALQNITGRKDLKSTAEWLQWKAKQDGSTVPLTAAPSAPRSVR